MNNKEFINDISAKTNMSTKSAGELLSALIAEISACLEEENNVSISGLGTFEVKKKMERVLINPTSKQRMLVPPKIVVSFKPAAILKEQANNK